MPVNPTINENDNIKRKAFSLILFIAISSLFCDMTHAGAKSLYGAFLYHIGASAAAIGFVSGLAQFTANSLSLLTGYVADKYHNYWTMTILGYLFCLIAIPALAFVPGYGWMAASALIVAERVGKACWQPARNTLISFASAEVGRGKSFSIQSFFNKLGACIGPLILFLVLLFNSDLSLLDRYHLCFAVLGIPALIGIIFLFLAKRKFAHPENFERYHNAESSQKQRTKEFVLFCLGVSFFGLGYLDFPLITLHLSKIAKINTEYLPLFFSGAMLVSAVAALTFGRLFDRIGVFVLVISTLISSTFSFFVFSSDHIGFLIIGILIWGVGIGAFETVLKSMTTFLVSKEKRSKGFGLLNLFFGFSLFAGSWLCGALYDISIPALILFSFFMQFAAVCFFWACHRRIKAEK